MTLCTHSEYLKLKSIGAFYPSTQKCGQPQWQWQPSKSATQRKQWLFGRYISITIVTFRSHIPYRNVYLAWTWTGHRRGADAVFSIIWLFHSWSMCPLIIVSIFHFAPATPNMNSVARIQNTGSTRRRQWPNFTMPLLGNRKEKNGNGLRNVCELERVWRTLGRGRKGNTDR